MDIEIYTHPHLTFQNMHTQGGMCVCVCVVIGFGGDIGSLTPSSSFLAPLSSVLPLQIETAIRDFGYVFQAPSLLPLLFAHWFSFLLCHPSPILFHVSLRLAFVVVLRPMSRARNSQFASIRSWLVVRSLHLNVAIYGGSLSSLQPSTSNIGGVANTPGSS